MLFFSGGGAGCARRCKWRKVQPCITLDKGRVTVCAEVSDKLVGVEIAVGAGEIDHFL